MSCKTSCARVDTSCTMDDHQIMLRRSYSVARLTSPLFGTFYACKQTAAVVAAADRSRKP